MTKNKPHQHQLLDQQRGEAGAKLCDPQQGCVKEAVEAQAVPALLPLDESGQYSPAQRGP